MNILLNCFPPSNIFMPDLGLSVLKQYLQSNNIRCDIIYWNILLDKVKKSTIYKDADNDLVGALLPYIYYLYPSKKENIKHAMQIRNPLLNSYSKNYYYDLLDGLIGQIDKTFDSTIYKYGIATDYTLIGVPYRFLQWIPSLIFINKLKKINPELRFVIGGLGTKIESLKLMECLPNIDYAIWGEGEIALKQLCHFIKENEIKYPTNVQSLLYRDEEDKIISNNIQKQYSELIVPDYSDYFKFNKISKKYVRLPIERSRGCSWLKCKFCYLNDGYKFRKKENSQLLENIKLFVSKYNIRKFDFHDNDLIGSDLKNTENLLSLLENYKKKYKIEFCSAEINSKNINENIINKFKNAGFTTFQVGIEAISDSKLQRIKKESTFINHLFIFKLCIKYNLRIVGANIILGFPDDSPEDVKVFINNLHYLRFYISEKFNLTSVLLNIKKNSPYYNELCLNQKKNWDSEFVDLMANDKIIENRFYLFEHTNKFSRILWENYEIIYDFYLRNKFQYKIFHNKKNNFFYYEYLNGKEIFQLEMNINEYNILKFCDKIVTVEDVENYIITQKISKRQFETTINKFLDERLIYKSEIDGSFLTIIDQFELYDYEEEKD